MDPVHQFLASESARATTTPTDKAVLPSQLALTVRQVAQILGMTPKAVYTAPSAASFPESSTWGARCASATPTY